MNLSIGELSRRAEVKVPTIRYYEQIGLMPETNRTEGKQRRYDKTAVARLAFIRHARELGFEVDPIRPLYAQCLPDAGNECAGGAVGGSLGPS